METMKLWNQVSETNPADTRRVDFGRKFTTIDAYSQIKKATELWGAFGSAWGVKEEEFTPTGEYPDTIILYQAIFYYPDGEFPIASSHALMPLVKGIPKLDDDCIKKVRTDALTKGLSMLGFNADVFMGKYDDNKYIQQMQKKYSGTQTKKPEDLTKKINAKLISMTDGSLKEIEALIIKATGDKYKSVKGTPKEYHGLLLKRLEELSNE